MDAYGWLHRGTVACAIELALDKPTTKYVDFAMSRVRMLQAFGVTPYLVFDGDALPSKAGTNKERRKRRDESKALGLELYRAGKISQAHQELQKAADVTPYMARLLIEELKRNNVQYIVAPYEADAQLVYLEQNGIINGILSEDSDMLVFGANRLITKLDQYGECVMIERADFTMCKEISLAGWTDAMFRRMAILSGCDYLPNISKMGLKTAYRFVRKYKEAEKTIRMVALEGKLSVPTDYLEHFQQAEWTFLYHRVFCPLQQRMVHLNEMPRGLKAEDMPYLGALVEADTAIGVACGDLNPRTKEPTVLKETPARPALKENRRQTLPVAPDLKPSKSIESFFGARRQPLAELDPNCLTPSPSQQRLLERHRNSAWAPRLASSAPQLRRAGSNTPATSSGADRSAFLSRASKVSTYQAPKRQRLCSEAQDPSPSKEVKQSPFFAGTAPQQSPLVDKKARKKKAKKAEFDIFSDDSVDDILLGLPDVQQAASPGDITYPDLSSLDNGEDDTAPRGSIPQSSPIKASSSRAATSQETEATSVEDPAQEDDIEPFEDLLESHIRMQKESLVKSFAYQSPNRRESALQSLSPRKAGAVVSTAFVTQSPGEQCAALTSLPRKATVHDVCKQVLGGKLSVTAPESPPQSSQSCRATVGARSSPNAVLSPSRDRLGTSPSKRSRAVFTTHHVCGSEDALIPNSEDEESEIDGAAQRPSLNLSAFTYIPAT